MTNPERDAFIEATAVSHETLAKLDRYAAMLEEWNAKFNMVAKSTLPHIWSRHFLDSWQLLKFIPDNAHSLADIGAGAGFPGLILAIMGPPQLHLHLIESTGKKANFLKTVVDELKLNVTVHHARVEDLKDLQVDIVTARAVALLSELMGLAKRLARNNSIYIFPKGQNADTELTESKKNWTFQCKKVPSITDDSGTVLVITNLNWNHGPKRRKR